ncbi:MAG: alpha/beta fold hydrolase [Candidatus Hodarchaeota archaeon]
MTYAYVNGINISYEVRGTGFPIIFIHGFGSKKEIWKSQIIDFSKKFKTITFDIRGTGESDRPNYPYSMQIFVDDIVGLMDFLQINKIHLVGRSFGGMIAQHFALSYPELLDKLILIATNYGRPDTEWVEIIKNNRLQEIQLLEISPEKAFWNKLRWIFHQNFQKELKNNPKKKFFGLFSAEDLIKESAINPSRPQDIINQAEAMKTHYTLESLNQIKNETLLIAASHDRLTPKSVMIDIHKRIPNSTLKVIENAGHFMTLSRAPEVNKIILDFLRN